MQTLLPERSARIHEAGRIGVVDNLPARRKGGCQALLDVFTSNRYVDVHGVAERLGRR